MKKKKAVVLGLDGVPYTLLKKFVADGTMPNLEKLLGQGTLSSMTASIPEVSSTSWSCFMTGMNPGNHGIYGFMEIDPEKYSFRFPNSTDLMSDTLWDIAAKNGKRSTIINIPSTYPAKPLNGQLVAGFVALDLKKACYPESTYDYLASIDYKLDVDARKAQTSMDDFTNDIIHTFKKRKEAVFHFLKNSAWDLFIAAVTETDRLHHYLWAALEDETHPFHGFFIAFYKELDKFIGAFYAMLEPETPFLMLSDHGFTSIRHEVFLNYYLQEKGYLKFSNDPPGSFQDMTADSSAFVLDPSRVYLHTSDRYSRGCVEPGEYEKTIESIKQDLLALQIDQQPVIKKIYNKEELYSGKALTFAPDLVLLPHEGFDLKGKISEKRLSGKSLLTGGHTRENAMFYINRKTAADCPNIMDVGTTVLDLLGLDTGHLDGKTLV